MKKTSRFILATVIGLLLGGIAHIISILAAPYLAEQDAFTRLSSTLDADQAVIISGVKGGETWLPRPDPAVAVAACAFDLAEGPMRIKTKVAPMFEAIALHGKRSGIFFALTDRAAVRGDIELVIMTQRQLDEARAADDDAGSAQPEVRVVAPDVEGSVVVRVAAALPSLKEQAEAQAKALTCSIDVDAQ
jgi:uncharacterized membrane protein